MSTKSLILTLDIGGSFDGTTALVLPPIVQNAAGHYVVTVAAAAGLLDPESVAELVGGRNGYWVHTVGISSLNALTTRVMVAVTQPKPSLAPGGNTISHPMILAIDRPSVVAQEPVTQGTYIPPGFTLQLLADDGAVATLGDCEVLLELESLPNQADAARAIGSQGFPVLPVALV